MTRCVKTAILKIILYGTAFQPAKEVGKVASDVNELWKRPVLLVQHFYEF